VQSFAKHQNDKRSGADQQAARVLLDEIEIPAVPKRKIKPQTERAVRNFTAPPRQRR